MKDAVETGFNIPIFIKIGAGNNTRNVGPHTAWWSHKPIFIY
jgi:hypothetical protein